MRAVLTVLVAAAAVALLLLVGLGGLAAGAASTYPALSGTIQGPTTLGESLKATYTIHAVGGPAEAPNTTIVGVYTYNATLAASNSSGMFVTPASGVLVNGTGNVTVAAPPVPEPLSLFVLVRSGYNGVNSSDNLTYTISIVQPYNLTATLVVAAGASVGPLGLTVTLDGTPVGSVAVPTLTGGSTYPLSFQYVATGLSPGWHTFAISLAQEHGLVTFAGGTESYSQSFYVPGPPPDDTAWYVVGAAAFIGTIFIWVTRVGARRRGRPKK
jgi:hypothetical protein